ncbi:MAG: B12-binding domain-containing protein, partial [Anaerolineales bacterium]|nr:B12-binding domain-containing protein [Anaerolineales bacterium]
MLSRHERSGDKFGAGELILPFVLQPAETMKRPFPILRIISKKWKASPREPSSLLIYGDVH